MEIIPVLQIRGALPCEAADIAAVLKEAFLAYEPLYTPGGFSATTPGAEEIQNRMRGNEGQIWVAVQDERVIGTVSAVPKGSALYIRSMAILPAQRGAGIGRKLLEAIERFALEQRFERMYLSTTPFLSAAIGLYERSGFESSADGPHDLHGTPLFTMIKIVDCRLHDC